MLSGEKVRDVMHVGAVEVPGETSVGQVLQDILPGQVLVVEDRQQRPLAVAPEDTLSTLPDPSRRLVEVKEHLAIPTLTSPDTPLSNIYRSMVYDRSIRWHVVLDENQHVIGVVPPSAVVHGVTGMSIFHGTSGAAGTLTFGPGGQLFGPSGELYSPPLTGAKPPGDLCYRCTHEPPHRFAPEEVHQRNTFNQALCPIDGSVMVAESPCQG
jgi:hypothetical protein